MSSMSSKCLPFNISFIFGNRKKSLGARSGDQRGPSVICLLAKKLPHRQCRVSRCIVMMRDPWVVGKKFGSFSSNLFMQPF
jgi:hypothetical protein